MERFRYNKAFDIDNSYDGKDLGAACTPQGTDFKLWAPFADRVELCLYGEGGAQALQSLDMEKGLRGVWHRRLEGDYHGFYYDYRIWTKGASVQTDRKSVV